MYTQQTLFDPNSHSHASRPIMVRELPESEQPKNKLLQQGAKALSNIELLALLIGQGTKEESELSLAEKLLCKYRDFGISGLTNLSAQEIKKVPGLSAAKAARIMAAVELGQRISMETSKVDVIHGPEDVAHFAIPRFRFEQKEHFAVLLLNTKNHILAMPEISIGSLTASVVHPREVFKEAVRYSAASMILIHNHPSGDPTPSNEDLMVTSRLLKCGEMMDIPVLDHVVVAGNRYYSLKQQGKLD